MKLVVLDGHTLNPGDLNWDGLRPFGELTVHERTPPELVVPRSAEAEVIFTNKTILSGDSLFALPSLRYIGVLATGFNVVDTQAARERGVTVTNVPGYGTASVAQMTLALILELTQQVGLHAQTVRAGRWANSPDFCYWDRPLVELQGLTLGLVGYGSIGRAVAELGRAFGMKVIVHTRTPKPDEPVTYTDLESLFSQADIVSLHCPLTSENRGFVNAARLASMKSTAFLVNTGRGPLVDEQALADALNRGEIAGAALDVLAVEPPRSENPLLQARNCIVTPHIAWATRAARSRLMETAVANLRAFLDGKPSNVVN
ncbi:MAG: D-2-hydroxyacid dehydrogenase [Pedosphaera sp.]|nr:D-2-hydroxyacid dehydrogenase [Pedosphaera sp.]